jgi:hypothetical protein
MGQIRNKKDLSRLPPFVPILWEVLNHDAYKKLPPSACKALPYFLGKWKGPYNVPEKLTTEFSFSYREANKLGFATTTHHRNICALIEFGFIDPYDKGGLKSDGKSYNLFRLSPRWLKYGTREFINNSWATFQPKSRRQR